MNFRFIDLLRLTQLPFIQIENVPYQLWICVQLRLTWPPSTEIENAPSQLWISYSLTFWDWHKPCLLRLRMYFLKSEFVTVWDWFIDLLRLTQPPFTQIENAPSQLWLYDSLTNWGCLNLNFLILRTHLLNCDRPHDEKEAVGDGQKLRRWRLRLLGSAWYIL